LPSGDPKKHGFSSALQRRIQVSRFRLFEGPILRLLLLRHAKSDWGTDADDHDRPLSSRGRKAGPEIAGYMRTAGYLPELVLCSTAQRTRETLDLLLPAWKQKPTIRYERALYLAEWPQLLAALTKAPGHVSPLLLVGHNPGIEQLAVALATEPESGEERTRMQSIAQKFPTGALAVLEFEIRTWRALKPGTGRIVDFVRPKDLGSRSGAKA
jgi:phosphohistidine phosphatase